MLINNNEYFTVLEDIKARIKTAQYKAVLGANKELIMLYWNIGNIRPPRKLKPSFKIDDTADKICA